MRPKLDPNWGLATALGPDHHLIKSAPENNHSGSFMSSQIMTMPLSSNRLITAREFSSPAMASERLPLARWHTRHRLSNHFYPLLRSKNLKERQNVMSTSRVRRNATEGHLSWHQEDTQPGKAKV
jgi:hypothetical protein